MENIYMAKASKNIVNSNNNSMMDDWGQWLRITDTMNRNDYDMEILSDASEEERDGDNAIDNSENDDTFETPPPRLTIGDVLNTIPKLKNGK